MFHQPFNIFAMFRNSAMAAQAKIIYDRVNAQRFGAELAAKSGPTGGSLSKARAFLARASAAPSDLTVAEARARLRLA
jgi:hypothetical protein